MILSKRIQIINLFFFLSLLIPLLLITGPFLPDLVVVLSTVYFLINFKFFQISTSDTFFKIGILFLVYIISNSFINFIIHDLNTYSSIKTSVFYLRFFIYVYFLKKIIEKNNHFFTYLFSFLLIIISVLCVDGIIQYVTGKNILGFEKICIRDCPKYFEDVISNNPIYSDFKTSDVDHIAQYRLTGFFKDRMIIGSYIARILPIFFATLFLCKKSSNIYKLISLVIILLSTILIFLSGERVAFIYLLLFLVSLIILCKLDIKFKLIIIISVIGNLFFISYIFPSAKYRIFNYTALQLGINQKYLNIDNKNILRNSFVMKSLENEYEDIKRKKNTSIFWLSHHHESHFKTALKIYIDNKFLGVGIKNFRNFCSDKKYKINKHSCTTHPHNIFLQFLSELGILGVFFYVIVLGYVYFSLVKHFINKYFYNREILQNSEICLLTYFAITFFPLFPYGNFFNNWLSIIMIYPIGILLSKRKKDLWNS